jgi:hypothetical protein
MNLFFFAWYALLAGGAYVTYEYYIMVEGSWRSPRGHHNPLLDVLLTCFLYVNMELIQLALSRIPRKHPPALPPPHLQAKANAGVHVIIAAHKAADSLRNILPSVLDAFPAANVWVADNGLQQDTDTQALCQEQGVQYRFYPIPNKTFALLKVAEEVAGNARALVLLDDDTLLPPGFFVRNDLLEQPLVAGYCVGIGVHKTSPLSLIEHVIDFEYRSISYRNENRARFGTINFLHGICAVYNTQRMLMIYSKLCTLPDGLPFGEDSFAGIDCRLAGYRLLQDPYNVVLTYCPRRIFPPVCPGALREQGFGASSLWKQRALRWYLSWPRRLPAELALGLCYDAGSWPGNVAYRIDLLWHLFIILAACGWPLYVVHVAATHQSFAMLGILHGFLYVTSVLTAAIRYAAFSPRLKDNVRLPTLLVVPLFNVTVCFLMACSFFIAIFHYIPFRRVNYHKCYAKAL